MQIRILIVDDDADICTVWKKYIERHWPNSEVYTANDGDSGLKLYDKLKPDLIVLDVMMPRINGWEVCHRIRRRERNTKKRSKIIMATVIGPSLNEMNASLFDADSYIDKPVSRQDLLKHIQQVQKT